MDLLDLKDAGLDNTPDLPLPDQGPPSRARADGLDLPDRPSPLETIYQGVANREPDRDAKVLDLARRLDEPLSFIDKNLPDVEKAVSGPNPSFFKELDDQY